jgi:hypothetical protein
MRKQLGLVAAVLLVGALILAASALAKPETFQIGNLFLTDDGGISPAKLPRHEQAPITAHLNAEIGTVDGSHPPAFRHLVADFDKTIQLDAKGLQACRLGRLQARTSAAARKACPESIVGSGEAEVEVAFPDQSPFSATGPVLVFNGGVRGRTTTVYLHTYVNVPAPTAVVATAEVTRINRGHFGLHVVADVPAIAGGSGSVTAFKIDLGRTFTYKGEKQSYLTASCPTGSYHAEAQALFSDGTALHIQHVLPCTPKD